MSNPPIKKKYRLPPLKQITFLKRYVMITLGIFLMTFGFYFFLVPVNLVVGGVSGLGIVLQTLFENVPIAVVIYILNALMLVLAFIFLGKNVFIRSIYGSLVFPSFVFIYELFFNPFAIEDFFLAAVFGGLILGFGFGFVIKYGGTSGGTDIPIKILNRLFKIRLSTAIYIIDGAIILLGFIAFLQTEGIEYGLYALIGVYLSGKGADIVVVGSNTLKAVHIITNEPETIKERIFQSIDRGVSLVPIEGGYSKANKIMLLTVITRNEYYIVREIMAECDPSAFVFASPATEIHGDFVLHTEEDS